MPQPPSPEPKMEGGLVHARGTIVWLLALACAFGAVAWIERESGHAVVAQPATGSAQPSSPQLAVSADLPPEPAPRALSEQERQWARIAWTYFENNLDRQTGLVHSVDGFPSTTMWDTASYLLALLAADDLELVDPRGFDIRMAKALVTLEQLPLYGGKLPNKSYDTASLAMTDYRNQPAPSGIGWSALDLGRLVAALDAVVWLHPVHTPAVRRVLARWDMAALARDGELLAMQAGAHGAAQAVQEGRLGYEQYAARSLARVGLDVEAAQDWRRHLQFVTVEGVAVCADDRDPARFGAPNYVVSEPYLLAGLESGWTRSARECAWRTYRAQEARFRKTGVLTAVTEDHVDRAPFFVYNTVWSNGRPWATVTDKGEDAAALRTLSVKAAFGWHALLRTEYTAKLVERVAPLNDPARGWYAGVYEDGGKTNQALAANTNAVVLESLAFLQRGRLLQYR